MRHRGLFYSLIKLAGSRACNAAESVSFNSAGLWAVVNVRLHLLVRLLTCSIGPRHTSYNQEGALLNGIIFLKHVFKKIKRKQSREYKDKAARGCLLEFGHGRNPYGARVSDLTASRNNSINNVKVAARCTVFSGICKL